MTASISTSFGRHDRFSVKLGGGNLLNKNVYDTAAASGSLCFARGMPRTHVVMIPCFPLAYKAEVAKAAIALLAILLTLGTVFADVTLTVVNNIAPPTMRTTASALFMLQQPVRRFARVLANRPAERLSCREPRCAFAVRRAARHADRLHIADPTTSVRAAKPASGSRSGDQPGYGPRDNGSIDERQADESVVRGSDVIGGIAC